MRSAVATLAALALAAPLGAQDHHHAAPPDSSAQAAMCQGGMMMMQGMEMMGSSMRSGMPGQSMTSGGMMPMATVMSDVMRFQARHVLAAGGDLELSSAQVQRLERLAAARNAAHHGSMDGGTWTAVRDALDAPKPDTAAVRKAAAHVVAEGSAMHVAMVVDAAAVKALLTAEQREKVPTAQGCATTPHTGSGEGHHHEQG